MDALIDKILALRGFDKSDKRAVELVRALLLGKQDDRHGL